MSDEPYNPLDKVNLGKSVAEALLDSPIHPLGNLPRFMGAGVYVLYYTGDFEPYRLMAERNQRALEWPIYIGKAVPPGTRRGMALFGPETAPSLRGRLQEHARSVRSAGNLDIDHFQCRYLIVEDIWIPLGEAMLITRFRPLWNQLVDGFGNHTPGAGRLKGMIPLWDVLHPGREWAPRHEPRPQTAEQIAEDVRKFLAGTALSADPHIDFGNTDEPD